MGKLKFKSTGIKVEKTDIHKAFNTIANYESKPVQQLEVKENKVRTPAKKVVYISKYGSKAIFDSINLCAKIFGKDTATIRYRIEHPKVKANLDFDWLEGGRLEYYND